MTLSSYSESTRTTSHPVHWTEDSYETEEFLIWLINENQIDYRVALHALEVTTLCDWRKSQAEAKVQILAWRDLNARIPTAHHPHWTEDLDQLLNFWTWCVVETQADPRVVLRALDIVALCDWRKSQAEAKVQILTWLGVSP